MKLTKRTLVGIAVPLVALFICAETTAEQPTPAREITIVVSAQGLMPQIIKVVRNERVRLIITSEELDDAISVRELNIEQQFRKGETKVIDFVPALAGRFAISCSGRGADHPTRLGELIVGESAAEASRMKVTFDTTLRGVVIVESAGERLRIDTLNNVVERIPDATTVADATTNSRQTSQSASNQSESVRANEPYDYHVINIPTPKAVRKHSLNMHFTHRFQETITPFEDEDASQHFARISQNLLGLDSSSVSSFGVTYGITDRLYANVYRSPICQPGLCKTIELGLGYHLLDESGRSPIALSVYSSVEGDYNFTERFTYNFQAMIGRSITRFVNVFFSPAAHVNTNGGNRFKEFLSSQPLISELRLGRHTGSFGFGVNARIRPSTSLLFEYTPRVGFKLGEIVPDFDPEIGQLVGFKNESEAAIGFGVEKRIGRHVFSLTFSNTQTTTTARYNSSNQALPPSKFSIGFNLFRRLL